jgi:phospholipase C
MPGVELLERVDTIVMVMIENRSFDHMLGALRHSRFGGRVDVDGLTSEANPQYQNFFEGRGYQPFHMLDGPLPCDLPHDRTLVETQLIYRPLAHS